MCLELTLRLLVVPHRMAKLVRVHITRCSQIKELIERIYAVPDGMSMAGARRPARVRRRFMKEHIVCTKCQCWHLALGLCVL